MLAQAAELLHRKRRKGLYFNKKEFKRNIFTPLKELIQDIIDDENHMDVLTSKLAFFNEYSLQDRLLDLFNENTNFFSNFYFDITTGVATIKRLRNHRIRKKAELPHLRIHDCRHQAASMLINNGRTLFEVAQILGHSDFSKVTQRYAHLQVSTMLDAANTISETLQGAIQETTCG